MRGLGAVVTGLVVGAAVTAGGYAVNAADQETTAGTRGPGTVTVTLDIRDSHFTPDRIAVWEGSQVRLVVRNHDPINHELVVGDEAIHQRHRGGTEAAHPPVPGEVSVGPGQTGATVIDVDHPGAMRMVCHLPRHEAFGMVGELLIRPRPGSS